MNCRLFKKGKDLNVIATLRFNPIVTIFLCLGGSLRRAKVLKTFLIRRLKEYKVIFLDISFYHQFYFNVK